MAKPSKARIAEKRHTHLWVIWEALRRNPSYRKAVADFLREVRAQRRQRRRQLAVMEDYPDPHSAAFEAWSEHVIDHRSYIQAYQTVLQSYRRVSRRLRLELTQTERIALEVMQGEAYSALCENILKILAPCYRLEVYHRVPALATFWQRWGIKFPFAPDLPNVFDGAFPFPQEMAVWVDDVDEAVHTATVTIRLDASKERVIADLDTAISHWLPQGKRRQSTANTIRLQPYTYYQEVFRVYDLYREGLSANEIAHRMWPEEFYKNQPIYPAKHPTVQKVRDRLRVANTLITQAGQK